jgi:hypothetical protein
MPEMAVSYFLFRAGKISFGFGFTPKIAAFCLCKTLRNICRILLKFCFGTAVAIE